MSVYEIDRAGRRISDRDQLEYATDDRRVLVTYNRADYQALDSQWRQDNRTHAGILWCTERSIPRSAIGDLVRAIAAVDADYDSLGGICMPLPRPS